MLLSRQSFLGLAFGLLLRLTLRLELLQPLLLLLEVLQQLAPLLHHHLLEHGVVALVVPKLTLKKRQKSFSMGRNRKCFKLNE